MEDRALLRARDQLSLASLGTWERVVTHVPRTYEKDGRSLMGSVGEGLGAQAAWEVVVRGASGAWMAVAAGSVAVDGVGSRDEGFWHFPESPGKQLVQGFPALTHAQAPDNVESE